MTTIATLCAHIAALPALPAAALGLAAGAGIGLVHFAQLRRGVRLLAAGRLHPALAGLTLRVSLSAAALATLAWLGRWALLAGLAGFLLARHAMLRRARASGGGPP